MNSFKSADQDIYKIHFFCVVNENTTKQCKKTNDTTLTYKLNIDNKIFRHKTPKTIFINKFVDKLTLFYQKLTN